MPGPAISPARYKVFSARVGNRRRMELANPDIARKAAASMTTKAINRGAFNTQYSTADRGSKFKNGVQNMASRMGTAEQQEAISKMDSRKLQDLYRNNKFVFEVYFDYGGTESKSGAVVKSEQNVKNTQFLIDQYEKAYGPIR